MIRGDTPWNSVKMREKGKNISPPVRRRTETAERRPPTMKLPALKPAGCGDRKRENDDFRELHTELCILPFFVFAVLFSCFFSFFRKCPVFPCAYSVFFHTRPLFFSVLASVFFCAHSCCRSNRCLRSLARFHFSLYSLLLQQRRFFQPSSTAFFFLRYFIRVYSILKMYTILLLTGIRRSADLFI